MNHTWQRVLFTFGTLSLVAPGCAHRDRVRAEIHEERAERAADRGQYHKAAREEQKARNAEYNAEHDPLP
jgi:hypothetical protein